MIDTRLIGYVALAFVAFLLYQAWMSDYGNAPDSVPAGNGAPTASQGRDLPDDNLAEAPLADTQPAADSTETSPAPVAPDDPAAERTAGNLIQVETDVLSLKINLQGGSIVEAGLLEYPVDLEHPDKPEHILDMHDPYFVAQSGLQARDAPAPNHYSDYSAGAQTYRLEAGEDELRVPLHWRDQNGLKVTKTFVLKRGEYAIDVVHRIDNQQGTEWIGRQYRQLQRTYSDEQSSYFMPTYTGGVIYSPENKYEKIDFEEMAQKPLDRRFAHGWAAMIEHYFLAAWIPDAEQINHYYSRGIDVAGGRRYLLALASPLQTVPPGQNATFNSTLYVGPKLQDRLEAVAPGLELTVDYGYLKILSQPLFWLLKKIHGFVGNWGWSIIILTLLIKLVFYKLSETSYKSMANMRRVQPKMQSLRERYKDDRQRLSQAMMELYKKEKINPLGGCLPMLVQIPVFIALYWMLLESVELRQVPWILWIKDLSVKDPYYVLPVIMGISMFIQQKLNPAPLDPVQAKVFMVLPFVFTVFFAFFPAGLVLYWVTNNVLTIAQQWFITHKVLADKPDKKKT